MHHRVDRELRAEAQRFSLVFTCRRCAHFDASVDGGVDGGVDGRCSLDFPVAPHLDVDLDTADVVTFCKAFELW